MVTVAEAPGPITTGPWVAGDQKPVGWEPPMVTMKCGVTERPETLCTLTVTASRRWVAFEVRKPSTDSRRGAEVNATQDTAAAATIGPATARAAHRRAAVARVRLAGAGVATVRAAIT